MKKTLLTLLICIAALHSNAQTTPVRTFRVAIFAPLYLDSVFSGYSYRYGKNFPKFALPGLDFVQGAQIALDSLPLVNASIRASIFDSKADDEDIDFLIKSKRLDSIDLIIGSVKEAEYLPLAAFALQKNIPFISATLPNDGGVTQNPFVIILNSTLRTHCEAIFASLLQLHAGDNIILARRRGAQEDKIAAYFKTINEPDGKPLLPIRVVNIDDDPNSLKLDSTKNNVIIGGSLQEDFSTTLVEQLYALKKTYRTKVIGMPNWDGFAGLKRSAFKEYPIYYSTPYVNSKTDAHSMHIQKMYLRKYKGTPSDFAYRGFEAVYLFSRILASYPNEFMSRLNDYSFKVFNEYNFKPVASAPNTIPDYFENKKLWMMKILNGRSVRAY